MSELRNRAPRPPGTHRLYRLQRRLARHRRPLAAACAGAAVLCLVRVLEPPAPPTVPVVVATHDLTGGTTVSASDVRVVRLPRAAVPESALATNASVVGRTLAGPVATGEMMSAGRLVGGSLINGFGSGLVAAPVRIADGDAVGLLQVGDRVDVYAADDQGPDAVAVVRAASVVTLPEADTDASRASGALVVLAVSSAEAARLAQQAARAPLSLTLRG